MERLHPRRPGTSTSARFVGDNLGGPERLDPGLALGAAAVKVYRNVHDPGFQCQWFI
jgi:hypothetical protein